MQIRLATTEDASRLLEIYSFYVENTAVTFEYEPPTLEGFTQRIATVLEKYPYLVVEDEGEIKGFAFAAPLRKRPAYDRAVEVTIYLDRNATKQGYGRALYEELEPRLKALGITNLYACIGDPVEEDEYLTRNSELFHRHMGFDIVGTFHKCGHKYGRWYNVIWAEKIISEHE